MKNYISHLRKVSLETVQKTTRSEGHADWEPLEIQIKRWWVNLPLITQQRPFQLVEIAVQCRGRYRDKPALRNVATALRSLDWVESRDWSNAGRNRRFWMPK
jgi:hypothetical protein